MVYKNDTHQTQDLPTLEESVCWSDAIDSNGISILIVAKLWACSRLSVAKPDFEP